jgi:hypothetical protein
VAELLWIDGDLSQLTDWELCRGVGTSPPTRDAGARHERFEHRALSARVALDRLSERLLPCDERCDPDHTSDRYLVIAALRIEQAAVAHDDWEDPAAVATDAPTWRATDLDGLLPAGTRLEKLTSTDPLLVYHTQPEHTLFRILDGPFIDQRLIATTYGPSPLADAVAGAGIVLDHPPAHDPRLVRRLVSYAGEIRARGESYQRLAASEGPDSELSAEIRAMIADITREPIAQAMERIHREVREHQRRRPQRSAQYHRDASAVDWNTSDGVPPIGGRHIIRRDVSIDPAPGQHLTLDAGTVLELVSIDENWWDEMGEARFCAATLQMRILSGPNAGVLFPLEIDGQDVPLRSGGRDISFRFPGWVAEGTCCMSARSNG